MQTAHEQRVNPPYFTAEFLIKSLERVAPNAEIRFFGSDGPLLNSVITSSDPTTGIVILCPLTAAKKKRWWHRSPV